MSLFRRKCFIANLSIVLSIVITLSACSTSSPSSSSDGKSSGEKDKAIKIGLSSALTGPYNEYGDSQKKVANLLVEQWNSKGGVAGRKVEFVYYDDQLDASKATVNVQKLINEDKVDGFVFPAGSTPVLAVLPMVVQSGLPAINSIATSAEIAYKEGTGSEPYANIFNFAMQNDIEAQALGKYVSSNWKRIGLITESTEYGKQAGEHIKRYIEKHTDAKLVAWEEYDQKAPDVTAQLGKLKKSGAEVISMVSLGADSATIRKGIARMGWDIPLIGTKGIFGVPYLEIAGDLVEGSRGITITTWLDPEKYTDKQKEFAKAWHHKYGNDRYYGPNEWPIANFSQQAYEYDGINVLLEAMDRAGTTDSQKVIDKINKLENFPGVLGVNYSFSPEVHHALGLEIFGVAEYKKVDGKIKVVPVD
jgi:branched-chain amino acid transport system substrate-binding protein